MANRVAANGWSLSADIGIEGARGGPWVAQRTALLRMRQGGRVNGAARARGEREEGQREAGHATIPSRRRTVLERIQERINRRPEEHEGDRMDEGPTVEERELERMGSIIARHGVWRA